LIPALVLFIRYAARFHFGSSTDPSCRQSKLITPSHPIKSFSAKVPSAAAMSASQACIAAWDIPDIMVCRSTNY
jgi:hypothetical protein